MVIFSTDWAAGLPVDKVCAQCRRFIIARTSRQEAIFERKDVDCRWMRFCKGPRVARYGGAIQTGFTFVYRPN